MTTTNLNDLDPDSPEFEEALRAAEAAAGEESSDDPDEQGGDEAAQQPADTGAEEPDSPQATAADDGGAPEVDAGAAQQEQPQPKVAGVASKDGKHVLPYAALKGARDEAKAERDARLAAEAKAAALEQQIADIKAGKTPKPEAEDGLDDETLQDLATDFPAVGKLAAAVKSMRETIKTLTGGAAAKQDDKPAQPSDDPVQDAIDSVPTLASWQYADHEKFNRAVQHDAVLKTSPKWRDKPLAERFAEATRRTAEEYDEPLTDIDTPKTTNTTTPKTQGKVPTTPQAPTRRQPSTLSDFKGGSGNTKTDDIRGLDAPAGVRAFEKMSDAEIDAYLRRVDGD